MENDYHAILIGVNEYASKEVKHLSYAEKDCTDLSRVLTHKDNGCFKSRNVKLLLGSDATTDRVKAALESVINEYHQNDTVLIYFSGHGFFQGSKNKVFIGTYDAQPSQVKKHANSGISLAYIREEVFARSKARNILLFLDCCFSGAIEPEKIKSKLYSSQNAIGVSRGGARIAFVSSAADSVSFEDDALKNSIFTHYILQGLKGDALNSVTGTVTLHSLMSYLSTAMPKEQTPGTFGSIFGEVKIADPGFAPKLKLPNRLSKFTSAVKYEHLEHPLEYYQNFIERLVSNLRLTGIETGAELERHVLNTIRRSSDADLVFTIKTTNDTWTIKSVSEFKGMPEDMVLYLETVTRKALSTINHGKLTTRSIHTIGHITFAHFYNDKSSSSKAIVIIPLMDEKPSEFLVIGGVPGEAAFMDDVYGVIMSCLYNSSKEAEGKSFNADDIEAAILDRLRQNYGFVPLKFYERRLELFTKHLHTTTIYFQPVIFIVPGFMRIDSWEALARDEKKIGKSGTPLVPNDLFQAAELWGDRFMLELDTYYLDLAVRNYMESRKKTHGMRRAEDLRPISVNVYPNSLTRRVYYEALKDVMDSGIIPGHFLVLEISEKTEIPHQVYSGDPASPVVHFQRRLLSLTREFGISFAMDDFGVGHSSISRWLHLKLNHVKIDRDILMEDPSTLTIQYVIDLAHQKLDSPKIILEGYDVDSPISLREIYYDLGVKYIQGYGTGKALPYLYRLDQVKEKDLMNQINQDLE